LFRNLSCEPRRGEGEVRRARRVLQAAVVQHGRREEKLGVYFDALNLAESATELVGTLAVVQQREGQYADRMSPRFSS
jgi:hypothetical protein